MAPDLRIASANLQHWTKLGGIKIDGKKWTKQQHLSKMAWARQIFASTRPHIIGLQEVYDQESVEEIFAHSTLASKQYRCHLSGGPPQQVGLVTSLALAEPITAIYELNDEPITICRNGLDLVVTKLSRPILKARLRHEGQVLTVFVAHLKSKVPSYGDDPRVQYPEEQLLTTDLAKRSLGNLVSLLRRGAEAAALRREIVRELEGTDNPVVVCGDLNDRTDAVTTEMVCGDPISTYIPPRRGKPYTSEEIAEIRRRLYRVVLTSTQDLQIKNTALSELYTNIHLGKYTSLDHILLSRHFFRQPHGVQDDEFEQRYHFNYFEVWNDHLVDGESVFAPKKDTTSDHGLVVAYLEKVSKKKKTVKKLGKKLGKEVVTLELGPGVEVAESPSDLEIR